MNRNTTAACLITIVLGIIAAALIIAGAVALSNAGMIADELSYMETPAGVENQGSVLSVSHTLLLSGFGFGVLFLVSLIWWQLKNRTAGRVNR